MLSAICHMYVLVSSFARLVTTGGLPVSPKTQHKSMAEMIRASCLDKSGFRQLDSDYVRAVEVVEGVDVSLPCGSSVCGEGEGDDDEPRIWRWRPWAEAEDDGGWRWREVRLGLAPEPAANRVLAHPNHTLVIRGVARDDAGHYVCGGPDGASDQFRFSLDLVQPNVSVLEANNIAWPQYEREVILRANEEIYESGEPGVGQLLDKVRIKVVSEWEPWSPCDGCKSLRYRYSKCRVRSHVNPGTRQLIKRANVISCHSLHLALWLPAIYSVTSAVPNLRQVQTCFDSCRRSEGRPAHVARYHAALNMDMGSSMAFACPDTDLRSKVIWKKDGVTMKPVGYRTVKKSSKYKHYYSKLLGRPPSARLERAFVDRMNTLQLCLVGPGESAVYTCYLANVPIKSVNISVVTAEETARQRRYHFWLLSCYTALLSTTVVGVGLCVGLLRRHQFVRIVQDEQ